MLDVPFDGDGPRFGDQRVGVLLRVGLVGAELVEIVVGGDVLVARQLFLQRVLGVDAGRQLGAAPNVPAAAARMMVRRCSKISRGVISPAPISGPNSFLRFMSVLRAVIDNTQYNRLFQ